MSHKVGIIGAGGRMGQLLIAEIQSSSDLHFMGGLDPHPEKAKISFPVFTDAADLFAASDIVIDFSVPDAAPPHARLAAESGKALLIGTTGLTTSHINEIKSASTKAPILVSANTSLGVNLIIQMTRKIATLLGPEYDIEILETHHRQKVDAPSGTALALGRAAAAGRGHPLEQAALYDRHGMTGARKAGAIGFATRRGGDVVGEHTVSFYGAGEQIEITHRATDRILFAKGALYCARWLIQQSPGFYSMDNIFKFD